MVMSHDVSIEVIRVATSKRQIMKVDEVDQLKEKKKLKDELSYATLGTTIKLD